MPEKRVVEKMCLTLFLANACFFEKNSKYCVPVLPFQVNRQTRRN